MASSSSLSIKLACIVVLCLVVSVSLVQGAITCSQVSSSLLPCMQYLRSNVVGAVPDACCNGVRSLNGAAQTPDDRRTACGCLKTTAKAMPDLNYDAAGALPGKCNVNIPYKISPDTDCSKVN